MAPLAVHCRGAAQDGHDVDVATVAEHVEEDAVVARAAAVASVGVGKVNNAACEWIDAHALDGNVDAGEVAGRQLIELLSRAFGDADAPGVPRARLGTAHTGSFHRQPLRRGRA